MPEFRPDAPGPMVPPGPRSAADDFQRELVRQFDAEAAFDRTDVGEAAAEIGPLPGRAEPFESSQADAPAVEAPEVDLGSAVIPNATASAEGPSVATTRSPAGHPEFARRALMEGRAPGLDSEAEGGPTLGPIARSFAGSPDWGAVEHPGRGVDESGLGDPFGDDRPRRSGRRPSDESAGADRAREAEAAAVDLSRTNELLQMLVESAQMSRASALPIAPRHPGVRHW